MFNELDRIRTINELGAFLEKTRGNKTAKSIAKDICTPEHLRDIERGRRAPSEGILFKLSKKLNVDSKELIFTLRRILAPDEIKAYYRNNGKTNTGVVFEHDKEHDKLKEEHDGLQNEVREMKEMLKRQEGMLSEVKDLLRQNKKLTVN